MTRAKTIPLMKSAFRNERATRKALARFVLKAPRFSMGEQCGKFEKAFASFQKRKEAVLVNSGASANLVLLQALKNLGQLKEGDKIGFSALTWSTNVMPIIQLGLVPVAVDCSPKTLNVMASDFLARLRQVKMKALFITNALGFTGDLDVIRTICRKKGVLLLEDNCESLGSRLPSGWAGNFGLASTFSFYVGHHMSTVEGGMICTDDADLAEMLKIVRANGWDRNLKSTQQNKLRRKFRVKDEFESKYAFYDLGFNVRPTEVTGFLGCNQLQGLQASFDQRESNYLELETVIAANPDLVLFEHAHIRKLSNFAVPILCKTPTLRDKYLARFVAAGIEVRPIIAGNIQKQPFYSKYVSKLYPLPGSDFIHNCGFYFGNSPELTKDDLKIISRCLKL